MAGHRVDAPTDRIIPDAPQGGPPTARNLGWYDAAPEQRYVAYMTLMPMFAEALVQGREDEIDDYAIWILGHAPYDVEANEAGVALILAAEEGPEREAMVTWHNQVYGDDGYYYEGVDSPYADLKLPKINTDDPDGTIDRFVTATLYEPLGPGEHVRHKDQYTDNLTEKAMLWGVGFFESLGNKTSELIDALGGPDADIIDPNEKYDRPDVDGVSTAELFRATGDEAYGPEESAKAWRRNLWHNLARIGTDTAVAYSAGGMAAAGRVSPIKSTLPGRIGRTRAQMSDGMARAWRSQTMGTVRNQALQPVAQAMKEITPLGLRRTLANNLNRLASSSTWAKSSDAPWMLRIAARARPRTKLAAAAAGTLGAQAGMSMVSGLRGQYDEATNYLNQMEDGPAKDYLQRVLAEKAQAEAETMPETGTRDVEAETFGRVRG